MQLAGFQCRGMSVSSDKEGGSSQEGGPLEDPEKVSFVALASRNKTSSSLKRQWDESPDQEKGQTPQEEAGGGRE